MAHRADKLQVLDELDEVTTKTPFEIEREALHSRLLSAFKRNDYGAFVSPSPMEGSRQGLGQFFRYIARPRSTPRAAAS